MENDYDLPTDRSLELSEHKFKPINSKTGRIETSSQIMIEKMNTHLTFIQNQFSRNMEWQRYLLSQIKNQQHRTEQARGRPFNDGLQLTLDQQRSLREILNHLLNSQKQNLTLKELIHQASRTLKTNRKLERSLVPEKDEIQEKIEFPVVQRVITLNDLAPSTQRQMSGTPSPLPPRTPKNKSRGKKDVKEKEFLTLTPKESEQLFSESSPEQGLMKFKSEEPPSSWRNRKQIMLQDSLGKRLFQDQKKKMIYIEDHSQNENQGSQVSLTLSVSHEEKKPSIGAFQCLQPRTNSIEYALRSSDFEHESIYIQIPNNSREVKNISHLERDGERQCGGLNFRDFPRRKVGKCRTRKQSYLVYQQGSIGYVKQMHDSFGEAYQEYCLSESSSNGKETSIYRFRNMQFRQD